MSLQNLTKWIPICSFQPAALAPFDNQIKKPFHSKTFNYSFPMMSNMYSIAVVVETLWIFNSVISFRANTLSIFHLSIKVRKLQSILPFPSWILKKLFSKSKVGNTEIQLPLFHNHQTGLMLLNHFSLNKLKPRKFIWGCSATLLWTFMSAIYFYRTFTSFPNWIATLFFNTSLPSKTGHYSYK